jgi:hypothetical protein
VVELVVSAAVVDVDAAAVVELVVSAADVDEVAAAGVVVDDVASSSEVEVASSDVEVASSEVEVASSVVDGVPGVLGVVVAGGPSVRATVVFGWVDGVVSTSVGMV